MTHQMPLRTPVPATEAPRVDPTVAEWRHRDGVSCITTSTYTYDANGWRRWCSDCGAELGERSWAENGLDVPRSAIGGAVVLLILVLAVVAGLIIMGLSPANSPGPGGPTAPSVVTPSPRGFPGANQHNVPDPGTRPRFN